MLTIFHAFNWQFCDLEQKLPDIAERGFHAVQISPAQTCQSDGRDWYLRYQPYDYSTIKGLGSQKDLEKLCNAAKNLGLFIIADLVFNHMAGVCTLAESQKAWEAQQKGDDKLVKAIEEKLESFPQFESTDFHPFFPISGFDYDDDALRLTGWGGDGTWPDLKPSKKVLDIQKQHIDLLYQSGVRGFRFDAVKQMHAKEQYQPLVEHCKSYGDVRYIYGEVLSTDPAMHKAYSEFTDSMDFILLHELVEAFEERDSLESLIAPPRLPCKAVEFSRNHDTVMQFLPKLSFTNQRLAALAGLYLLSLCNNVVLVLASDLEDSELSSFTEVGLRFRLSVQKEITKNPRIVMPFMTKNSSKKATSPRVKQMQRCLWVSHGVQGGVLINASEKPLSLETLGFHDFELNGSYVFERVSKKENRIISGQIVFHQPDDLHYKIKHEQSFDHSREMRQELLFPFSSHHIQVESLSSMTFIKTAHPESENSISNII